MLVGVSAGQPTRRFDSALVAGLDEPVRRYLTRAVAPGPVLTERVRLTMHGRIKVGRWMELTADQDFNAHEFERRFAPHQLRHAHAVEMAHEGFRSL